MGCTILLKSSEASADYKERHKTIDFALLLLSKRGGKKEKLFTFCLYLVPLPDDTSINHYEIIVYF